MHNRGLELPEARTPPLASPSHPSEPSPSSPPAPTPLPGRRAAVPFVPHIPLPAEIGGSWPGESEVGGDAGRRAHSRTIGTAKRSVDPSVSGPKPVPEVDRSRTGAALPFLSRRPGSPLPHHKTASSSSADRMPTLPRSPTETAAGGQIQITSVGLPSNPSSVPTILRASTISYRFSTTAAASAP